LSLPYVSKLKQSFISVTTLLLCRPREVVASFRASLADAYNSHHTTHSSHSPDATDAWISFKAAVLVASVNLPPLPRKKEVDWITDEVRNLSQKKTSAWLHLRNLTNEDNDQYKTTLAEYRWFRRLTKVAAEKARNAWWSARAVEAEMKAWVAQQQGRCGSLIKELRLLKRQAFKTSSSYLLAKDNTIVSSDTGKLQCWAEYFAEVSQNCSVGSQVDIDLLPDIVAAISSYGDNFADDDDVSQHITEEDIH